MTDPYANARCPLDGSELYDNRERKASGRYKPTYPDFRCMACDAGGWLNADGSWSWKPSTRQPLHTPHYTRTHTPRG